MHHSPRLLGALLLFVGVAGMGLTGCGKTEPEENQAATHLRKIAQAYDEAIYRNHRPPRSMEDLKPFIEQMSDPDGVDVLLRSPNDGEPYEIVWGINLDRVTNTSLLIAYEKKGVDGKRYAINVARIVKHLTDAEIGNPSPKGKRPVGE